MADELRAAAERIRNHSIGPHLFKHGGDMATLAFGYLAEHPADDSLAIDEEWLRSVGFSVLWDVEKEFRFPTATDAHLALFCPSRREGYSCCLGGPSSYAPLPDIRTRGDLRLLCRALGIEMKGQP